MFRYFLVYKPFNVLSQYLSEGNKLGLGSLFDFPPNVYPVGRLDADSEGLIILTDDTKLNKLLLDPTNGHWRTYFVQVEGQINDEAINKLVSGVEINIDGKSFFTKMAQVEKIEIPILPERIPPIRFRKNIPTSWIRLSLTEGKNRQVRRMTASVGFPTLRLVRVSIGNIIMENMLSGKVVELNSNFVYNNIKS